MLLFIESPRGDEVIIDDMILTQEQYELLYGEGTRSGVPEAWERRWPNKKLPYEIHSSVLSSDIAIIESTITFCTIDTNIVLSGVAFNNCSNHR